MKKVKVILLLFVSAALFSMGALAFTQERVQKDADMPDLIMTTIPIDEIEEVEEQEPIEILDSEEVPVINEGENIDVEAFDDFSASLDSIFDGESFLQLMNSNYSLEVEMLKRYLERLGVDRESLREGMRQYIDLTLSYDSPRADRSSLISLLLQGYEPDRVMEIYRFVENNGCDISWVQKIYDAAKSSMAEPFWREECYAELRGTQDDELSVTDIANYVEQGIDVDEILACYEWSQLASASIRNILNARTAGAEWDVALGMNQADADALESMGEIAPRMAVQMNAIARQLGKSIAQIVDTANGELAQEARQALEAKRERIQNYQAALNVDAEAQEFVSAGEKKAQKYPADPFELIENTNEMMDEIPTEEEEAA